MYYSQDLGYKQGFLVISVGLGESLRDSDTRLAARIRFLLQHRAHTLALDNRVWRYLSQMQRIDGTHYRFHPLEPSAVGPTEVGI